MPVEQTVDSRVGGQTIAEVVGAGEIYVRMCSKLNVPVAGSIASMPSMKTVV
jgi:hypothetical protein